MQPVRATNETLRPFRNSLEVLSTFIVPFLRDENGQGMVEYIVILSASVAGAVALARQIIKAMDAGVLRLGAQLEQDLKTGRAPLSVWQN